jgi:uncharacterized membrane protein (UPF0127 family)
LKYSLINETKGNVIAENIIIADKFWARMRGLMGKKELKYDEGLLLVPCNAVHMMFMRFPIDVLFLDKDFVVVKIIDKMRPWRTSPIVRGAYQVIELNAGTAKAKEIFAGDIMSISKVYK